MDRNHQCWTPEVDEILRIGESLIPYGVFNYVVTAQQAINAVCRLREAGIPILGGDVYLKRNDGFEITYDNWHYDPSDDENHDVKVSKSCEKAIDFINNYQFKGAYFALVPEVS